MKQSTITAQFPCDIKNAYKAYNLDGPTALEFGIRDGAPYYNETELRLSEKELRELFFNM